MKRILMMMAALASLAFVAAPSPALARTSFGISVNIGDPYRGASFRFRSAPDLVLIPGTRVYFADNYDDYYGCDVYRYGSWWYLVDDGYWYRSRGYSGPFYAIDDDYVPSVFFAFYDVPVRYHSYWGGSFAYRGGDWTWYRGRSYPAYGTYYRYSNGSYRTYRDRAGTTNYRDRNVYDSGSRTYRTRDSWQDRQYQRQPAPTREGTWTRQQTPSRERTWDRQQQAPSRERSWSRDRTQQQQPPQQQQPAQEQRSWRNRDRGSDNNSGDSGNGNANGNGGQQRERGNKGGRGHGRGHGND
jgi:hypothetical protein